MPGAIGAFKYYVDKKGPIEGMGGHNWDHVVFLRMFNLIMTFN